MKDLGVGDEVLVKMVVVGPSLEDGDVYLEYSAHTGNRIDPYMNWVNTELVVENLGRPTPPEPMGLGAVVDAMSTDVPEDNGKWVRADIHPTHPWTLVGADVPTSCTWERLSTGRRVTVLSEGLS